MEETFSVMCKSTIDNRINVFNYSNVKYQPISYTFEISPKSIFIPASSDGKFLGSETTFVKEFSFKILDENKQPLPFNQADAKITLKKQTGDEDGTSLSSKTLSPSSWSDIYNLSIDTSTKNNLWDSDVDSKTYEVNFTYLGNQFSEEIEVIKNYSGVQGTVGTGYTIHLSNEAVILPGTIVKAIPDIEKNIEILAYKNTTRIAAKVKSINGIDITTSNQTNFLGVTGFKISITSNNSTSPSIKITTTDNLEEDGQIIFQLEADGKLFRNYWSYSIAKKGENGSSGNTYQLQVKPSILIYRIENGEGKFYKPDGTSASIETNAVKYRGEEMIEESYSGIVEFYGATENTVWQLLGEKTGSTIYWTNTSGILKYRNFKFILYDSNKTRVLD